MKYLGQSGLPGINNSQLFSQPRQNEQDNLSRDDKLSKNSFNLGEIGEELEPSTPYKSPSQKKEAKLGAMSSENKRPFSQDKESGDSPSLSHRYSRTDLKKRPSNAMKNVMEAL